MPPGFGGSQPMPLPMAHGAPRSKALPLVVAAGLAIGVFGGLIIINGTGKAKAGESEKEAAIASPDAGATEVAVAPTIDAAVLVQPAAAIIDAGVVDAAPAIELAKLEPDAAAATAPSSSSRSSSSSSSSSPSSSSSSRRNPRTTRTGSSNDDATFTPGVFGDSSADPVADSATLRFDVTPPGPPGLSVSVDGAKVSGSSHTLKLGGTARKVKVEASAKGYRSWERSYTVRRDQTIRIRLRRPKSDSAPGGLIDL